MPDARRTRARGASGPRATRAFLFSDLRDYTSFVEHQGDAAAARLLKDYRAIVRREVARHEGAEVKTEGDSFYVVFSSPRDALECAVAILKRVELHGQRHAERPIRVAIGLHAGETVEFDDQFVGSAVIVGSRLCSRAKVGELLISDTFRGLVRTGQSYAMEDRGALRLKGVSERVKAWSVQWGLAAVTTAPPVSKADSRSVTLPLAEPRPAPAPGALVCPVLVGREPELGLFDQFLAAAASGKGRTVLVSGEAGVGKTALVREVERRAVAQGFRLLSGVTLESDTGVPYAPFVSAIRWGLRDLQREEVGRVLTTVAPELAQLFPEARGHGRADQATTVERTRLSVALQWLLAALAKDAPLLLVVDDLHWADEASLALLHFLTREIRDARVLLIGTYRSDDLHQRHPLSRLLATFQRERCSTEVGLRRLTADQVAGLMRETLALTEPGLRITADFRDAIFARSGGNPFFTEELLRSLVESGGIFFEESTGWKRKPIDQLTIPDSIRDIIRSRLERLPEEARAALSAAAVVGVRVGFDLLQAVTGIEELALARQLQQCIDEQLLVEIADAREAAYAFRHALTRDVVYESLLLPVRRHLHLRIAQRLAADPDVPPALVAPHWRAGGDNERAAEAFEAAARKALAIHAPAQAVAHFEAAITARGDATLGHYLGLARAYLALDHRKARDAAERALALMGSGDEELADRVELMQIAGTARLLGGDAGGNLDLARKAVELVETRPDSLAKARAFDWFARAQIAHGDDDAAHRWAERALTVARAVDDGATEASALCTMGVSASLARPVTGLALIDEAAAVARSAANLSAFSDRARPSPEIEAIAPQVLARAHHNGIAYSFNSETARKRFVRLEQAATFVRRYGYERSTIASFRALNGFLAGDWPPDGSFDIPGDREGDMFVGWVELLQVLVTAARSGPTDQLLDSARSIAARAIRQNEAQWAVPWLSYECLLLAWAGRVDDLRDRVGTMLRFVDAASGSQARELSLVAAGRGFNTAAVALFIAGERDRLVRMAAALEGAEGYGGDAARIRAFVAGLDGDDAAAHLEFTGASGAFRDRGLAISSAVDLWALGRARPLDERWSSEIAEASDLLQRAQAGWFAAALSEVTRR